MRVSMHCAHVMEKIMIMPASPCRAIFALQLDAIARSDDVRQLGLADICEPQTYTSIGPSPCYAMQFVLNAGKTNSSGQPECMAVIRHVNPWLCAIGWIGRLFFTKYTVGQQAFPLPTKQDDLRAW